MMNNSFDRFDQVRLLTTQRVNWRSHPTDQEPDPNGIWLVSDIVGGELLLTQNSAVIKIPFDDVQLINKYNILTALNESFRTFRNPSNGQD